MTDSAHTDRILRQGKDLVRAIEALSTIEPSNSIERALARLLLVFTQKPGPSFQHATLRALSQVDGGKRWSGLLSAR